MMVKPKPKPAPKKAEGADRKVIIEYSSDEGPEEGRQPGEGAEAPKRVTRRIHLMLPTNPSHVTTTETFTTFFINHGLMRALRKAFEKQGWSTNQMRELVANFQQKHGQQVRMPKLYGDEDSSDSEGLELADGTKVGKKTAGSAGGSGGASSGRNPQPVVVVIPAQVAVVVPAQVVAVAQAGPEVTTQAGAESGVKAAMVVMEMTQTNAGRRGMRVDHQDRSWPVKNHAKWAQLTPQSTKSCQSSTSLARRREPCWAIACWTGLWSRRRRYRRRGCRGG